MQRLIPSLFFGFICSFVLIAHFATAVKIPFVKLKHLGYLK